MTGIRRCSDGPDKTAGSLPRGRWGDVEVLVADVIQISAQVSSTYPVTSHGAATPGESCTRLRQTERLGDIRPLPAYGAPSGFLLSLIRI